MALPFWLTKLLVRTGIARFTPLAKRLTDGGTDYLRYYSDRVLAAPVEELLDPAFVPDACGPDVFDLNPDAPRSESGVSLGRLTADRRGNPPPHGLPELRSAIADRYKRIDRVFDRPVALDLEGPVASGARVLAALTRYLPYTLRAELAEKPKRAPHLDIQRAEVGLDGIEWTTRGVILAILKALPPGWQATLLAGRIILYKETHDYKYGTIIGRSGE